MRIEADRFEIIYNAEQRQLAEHYLLTAVAIDQELATAFTERPKKTYLVLLDRTDVSNGAATVFPEPTIFLYPTLPESNDSIYNHGDWAYLLLKHEYVHILNMYPSNGTAGVLKNIFGAWVRPNMFLPNWYKEGLATELESEGKRFGRLNSEYVLGWLRASVLDGTWQQESVDRINSFSVPVYPYGQRPYYYGAFMWQYLVENYGTEIREDLNQAYSRRVPWWIESPLRNQSGKSYAENFNAMKDYWQEKVSLESKDKSLASDSLGLLGYEQAYYSRNQNFAVYTSKDKANETNLRLIEYSSPDSWEILSDTVIARSVKITSASIYKDKVYYGRINTNLRKNKFSDIYVYDLSTKKSSNLTKGERTRFPALTADGELYYLKTENNVQSLIKHSDKENSLYKSGLNESLHSLVAIDESLFFLKKYPSGTHSIYALDTNTNSIKNIFQSNSNIYSIKRCGANLCMSMAKNAYADLNLLNLNTLKLEKLTSTASFVFDGLISNNKLIFSEMTSDGLKYKYKKDFVRESVAHSYADEAGLDLPTQDFDEKRYFSTRHLLPKYWFPFISYDANGTYYQINTGGNDPLSLQSYFLSLSYYTANQKWDQSFLYTNSYWDSTWFLQATRENDYIQAIDNSIEKHFYRLGLSNYIFGLSNSWTWQLIVENQEAKFANTSFAEASGAGISIRYEDIDSVPIGHILPSKGLSFKAGHTHYIDDKDLISFDVSEFEYRQYTSYLLPQKHGLDTHLLARYSEEEGRSLGLGTKSIGGPFYGNNTYSLKGYPTSNFVAFSAANLKLNYSLPLYDIYRGEGTLPYFLKYLFLNLTYEGLVFDGLYYDRDFKLKREQHDEVYSSYGVELKLATELFYLAPVNFVFGVYVGDNKGAGGDIFSVINLEAPNFF